MIKMTATSPDGKRKLAAFGLSDGNLAKLREGKPIYIFGAEMGIDHDILIFWGETEEKLAEMVRKDGLIGPDTIVRDELTNRPRKS